jgi:ATP-dependent DNA ligase
MVRRDGSRVRCFTRNGHDWADRFPSIVEAAARLEAHSFLIDGEAVIARDDGHCAGRSERRYLSVKSRLSTIPDVSRWVLGYVWATHPSRTRANAC